MYCVVWYRFSLFLRFVSIRFCNYYDSVVFYNYSDNVVFCNYSDRVVF